MEILRKHWYDLGGLFSFVVAFKIYEGWMENVYDTIMWMSLLSLFIHQLEEYRIVGTFPGMVNRILYRSPIPDRFPLNTNTSLIINVVLGWGVYYLAALLGEQFVWLGIASMLVSVGNVLAHTFLFNIKGRTIYNAGLASCWLLFAPISIYFFYTIHSEGLVSLTDYLIGVPLGMLINYVGVIKLIDWMGDKSTTYRFETRNLLPADRVDYSSFNKRV